VNGPVKHAGPPAGLLAGPAAVWAPDTPDAPDVPDSDDAPGVSAVPDVDVSHGVDDGGALWLPREPSGEEADAAEHGAPDPSDAVDEGAGWLPFWPDDQADQSLEEVRDTLEAPRDQAGQAHETENAEEPEGSEDPKSAIPSGSDTPAPPAPGPSAAVNAMQNAETMVIERIVESATGTELLTDIRRLSPPPVPVAFRPLPAPESERTYAEPVRVPEFPARRLYGEGWTEVARQIGAEVTRWGAMRIAAIHHAPDRNADDETDTVPPAVRTAAYFGFGRTPLEWDGTRYIGGEPLPGRMSPAVIMFGLAQHVRDHPAVAP
jgi:hypothetical protein